MTLERRHQTSVSGFTSQGTESGQHFYPCGLISDPFTSEGELVRVLSWPKVDLFWAGSSSTVPPEFSWATANMTWIAYFSFDGTVPPQSQISPYSANCVLRSGLTPTYVPSTVVVGGYHMLFTCDAQGIDSKRIVKPQDPVLTARVITGLWVNDGNLIPGSYQNFHINGSSTDYTIWQKQV